MNLIEPESTVCLCNFIIQQQKYIENMNKNMNNKIEISLNTSLNKDKQCVLYNKLTKLCDIVNIEYETMQINNLVANNTIYHNGKKIVISDNVEQYGWLIIVNNSYILNQSIQPPIEWCLIYDNINKLAKEYSNVYFNILEKGLSLNMTMAIYYGTITTINLNILINNELYSYIRKIIGLFSEDEKKIAIYEISNLIRVLRLGE